MLISMILLAVSLSLDALGVGIIYGFRQIRIPFIPKCIICMFSIIYSGLALISGNLLAHILSPQSAKWIGFSILIVMGCWIIIQGWFNNRQNNQNSTSTNQAAVTLFEMAIKSLGITIQVIRNPVEFDMDASGTIDGFEAFLLGFGLSLDAIGVGIGSALVGFHSLIIPILVGLFQMGFLYIGGLCGEKFATCLSLDSKWLSIIPGFLLILFAFVRI